jgi:hypothetical protein
MIALLRAAVERGVSPYISQTCSEKPSHLA